MRAGGAALAFSGPSFFSLQVSALDVLLFRIEEADVNLQITED